MKLFYGVERKKWMKVMRISGTQLLLALVFASVTYARDSNAQVNLNQRIDLNADNVHISRILEKIEKITNTKFVYSLNVVNLAQKATVKAENEKLSEVLDQLLVKNGIGYMVINNRIVLSPIFNERDRESSRLVIPPIISPNTSSFEVSGKVTDDKGSPLIGVTVQVKNTNIGTVTNVQGDYTVRPLTGEDTLVFSSIGYLTRDVAIKGRDRINVSLKNSASGLNEVVVVGYGTQKKSDLTGSLSSIKGQDLTHLPTQRVDEALQGRAAGVMVTNTDGAPGGNTAIRIRGINSIYGGNNALVVIDGMQGGNLSSLNPGDISSIVILKDASATAIYGSRGANGVILITTKRGEIGKPVISYNYTISRATLIRKIPLLNAAQYAENVNEVQLSKNGNGITPLPIFSGAQIDSFKRFGGTNWQDVIFRPAITQNYQLSISGATDKLSYRVSGEYLDQNGIIVNSNYKRYSLLAGLNADITKWAKFNVDWNGTREEANSILFGSSIDWPNNPIAGALQFAPTVPVFDSAGNYSRGALHYGNPTVWNPLADAKEPMIDNLTVTNRINASLEFILLKGLTLKIMGGAILTNLDDLSYFNLKTFDGSQQDGHGIDNNDRSVYLQNSNTLTFDRYFNKNHLTVTALQEQEITTDYSSGINASSFLNQQTNVFDFSGAGIRNISSNYSKRVIKSYMGRINYGYNGKYLATVSYRADGSSVFGANNKWGFFPAAAIAWRASEESFIKSLNIFSDLKVRLSWGITGNQAISPYQTLASVGSGNNYPYDGGDATNVGLYLASPANPNLKWESTTQADLGIDAGWFNGRLTFTGDIYDKKTTNLLMPQNLPTYSGFSSVIANVGSMGNKGIEVAIGGDPIVQNNFSWHSSFQISSNRTMVISLGNDRMLGFKSGGSGSGTNRAFMYLVPGQPFGQMYGWKYLGVWSTSQAKEAEVYGQLPGDPHYFDKNKDGKIDINDTTVIGNSLPKFTYGWSNEFSYKNFGISFLIEGRYGDDVFNVARITLEAPEGTSAILLHRWTPQNQDSNIPGIIDGKTRQAAHLVSKIAFPPSSGNTLSRYVENASYIRLNSVTLAYNFSKTLLKKIHFSDASVYVSGMNLLTITKYTGYDPEVSSYTGNDAEMGSDFNNYPTSRTFSLGLKFSF